jgi:MinD superfamily P-loop ATPase
LHDLKLAVQVTRELGIPVGVIVNRDNGTYPALETFCANHNLPVLLRIPFERAIAVGIAQGKTLVEIRPEYIHHFSQVFQQISVLHAEQRSI